MNSNQFRHCERSEAISLRSPRRYAPRDDALFRGFTLVEILLVIALIATLGTWIVTLIDPPQQFKKGRDAERKAEMRQIQAALELYRSEHGAYPDALPACGNEFKDENTNTSYIRKIPCDPKTSKDYFYKYESPNYTLIACLENIYDPQKDENNDPKCAGGETRSYTLINP